MKIKHSFLLWGLVFLLFVSCGENKIISQARLKVWNRVIALFWG